MGALSCQSSRRPCKAQWSLGRHTRFLSGSSGIVAFSRKVQRRLGVLGGGPNDVKEQCPASFPPCVAEKREAFSGPACVAYVESTVGLGQEEDIGFGAVYEGAPVLEDLSDGAEHEGVQAAAVAV